MFLGLFFRHFFLSISFSQHLILFLLLLFLIHFLLLLSFYNHVHTTIILGILSNCLILVHLHILRFSFIVFKFLDIILLSLCLKLLLLIINRIFICTSSSLGSIMFILLRQLLVWYLVILLSINMDWGGTGVPYKLL